MSDIQDEDFAALFAASEKTRRFRNGQTIEGKIVAINADTAFVNVGAKGEATIDLSELRNDEGELEVAVGDLIQATVLSTAGGVTLSRRLQRGAAAASRLEDAFRAGLPVEGKVEGQVKGGYNVSIAKQRAFCPLSQIDSVRTEEPAVHEGRVYTFKILEYAEGGRKFVVSRRALLQQEQKAQAATMRQSISPGSVLSGRVVSVRDFGAFVDIGGGVQGLLHVSEMSWTRVNDPAQVVTAGQEIKVKVLRVEDGKIALGLKQLQEDPWTAAAANFKTGQVVTGTVERHEKFGIFVALAPAVTGLVPLGETGLPRDTDARKSFPVGKEIEVILLDIDAAARRIRLSVKGVDDAREAAEVRDYSQRAETTKAQSFGSLADKLRGALKTSE
ncbi:MAG: S1 RNA-binding domain-containing protein [Acidobacteriota bacterium]